MPKTLWGASVVLLMLGILAMAVEPAVAESEHGSAGLGASLPLWSALPFAGILLSIALFPLLAPKFWHHHFGKISALWAVLFAAPFLFAYGGEALHEILHIYIADYIPFIILLWALFTVAGGIYIKGSLWGSPTSNSILLVLGTVIASWVGTTGASMLLIRPMLRMNKARKNKVHLVVFFIFLVSNIGGALTPLGDPPLFLGFLHGVPFFWTFNLFPPMLFVSVALLVIFFIFDTIMYRREGLAGTHAIRDIDVDLDDDHSGSIVIEEEFTGSPGKSKLKKEKLAIEGLVNLIFLAGIVGGVLFSGYVKIGTLNILGVHTPIEFVVRDVFLVLMGLLSLRFTEKQIRKGNEFSWFPIQEVAILFAGIFMTIIPALKMLQAGAHGHLAFIIEAVKNPAQYFWITGTLSSFLDNAPTYLTFFNTALGSLELTEAQIAEALRYSHSVLAQHGFAEELIQKMETFSPFLLAISCGAVFFGANTYIGNAPNFMVKSIAEENNIKMPSFFGYMIYSILILVPLFVLTSFIFF
jgi:Na+/H+ antiporter NhaD/arsenite permease-like protein